MKFEGIDQSRKFIEALSDFLVRSGIINDSISEYGLQCIILGWLIKYGEETKDVTK